MSLFKSLLKGNKTDKDALKLKFNKHDNMWMVLKGHSIMFVGQEQQCKTYMSQFG